MTGSMDVTLLWLTIQAAFWVFCFLAVLALCAIAIVGPPAYLTFLIVRKVRA